MMNTVNLLVFVQLLANQSTAQYIRLVNGNSLEEGRVEVFANGVWGTICDDNWSFNDANVACNQLGFPGAVQSYSNAYFGQGSGSILLDDLACNGDEDSLFDCGHRGLGSHNCFHGEDAGVKCSKDIRLVSGNSLEEGRVEVFANGVWGTVCDDNWSFNDANVACKQLGFPGAVQSYSNAHFGQGSGSILLDDLACNGDEDSLFDCGHRGLGSHNCVHGEDAGVKCSKDQSTSYTIDESILGWQTTDESTSAEQPTTPTPTTVAFEPTWLPTTVDVSSELTSDLEIGWYNESFYNQSYSHITSPGFPGRYGNHVYQKYTIEAPYGKIIEISFSHIKIEDYYDYLKVYDGPTTSAQLLASITGHIVVQPIRSTQNSMHLVFRTDLSVTYSGFSCVARFLSPDIRLVSGNSLEEGRVEVFANGVWGTVCDDNWSFNDANVACKQLGFPGAVQSYSNAHFGQGSGSILLDDLACNGDEDSLFDCGHRGLGSHNCVHGEDAGVKCSKDQSTNYITDQSTSYTIDESILGWQTTDESTSAEQPTTPTPTTVAFESTWLPTTIDVSSDTDECALGRTICSSNAQCTNSIGSYTCTCNSGYSGDGIFCYAECDLYYCHENARCVADGGSFSCECLPGYSGDGIYCIDKSKEILLHCSPTSFEVDIPREMIGHNDGGDVLKLAEDDSCVGYINGNYITINSTFEQCGTIFSENGTHNIYHNTVVDSSEENGAVIVRYLHVAVPFSCIFDRIHSFSNFEFETFVLNKFTIEHKQATVELDYTFGMYKSNLYQQEIIGHPVMVPLNYEMHFRVEVLSAPGNLELFVRSCRATPTPSFNNSDEYEFVSEGCGVTDTTLQIYDNPSPFQFDFKLSSFRFTSTLDPSVYVYCEVLLCDKNDPTSECNQGCEGARRRRKVYALKESTKLMKGPIVVTNEKYKAKELAAEKKEARTLNSIQSLSSGVMIVVAAACLAGILLIGNVFIGYARRRYETYEAIPQTDF